jgi:hypothetical protein
MYYMLLLYCYIVILYVIYYMLYAYCIKPISVWPMLYVICYCIKPIISLYYMLYVIVLNPSPYAMPYEYVLNPTSILSFYVLNTKCVQVVSSPPVPRSKEMLKVLKVSIYIPTYPYNPHSYTHITI